MEATKDHAINSQSTASISLTLLSHREQTQQPVSAYSQQTVGELLAQLLKQLAQGNRSKHVVQMLECYEPVLERLCDGEGIPLENEQSLEEAGLCNGDTVQIAARPLKEKLLFCRYSALSS